MVDKIGENNNSQNKTLNIGGKELNLKLSDSNANEKKQGEPSSNQKSNFSPETTKLIRSLHPATLESGERGKSGENIVLKRANEVYESITQNEGPHKAKEWLEALEEKLENKKELIEQQKNVSENGIAANNTMGNAPSASLASMEAISEISNNVPGTSETETSLKKKLRDKKEIVAIKNKLVTRQFMNVVEVAKIEVAADITAADDELNILLKEGRILTPEEKKTINESTQEAKEAIPILLKSKFDLDLGILSAKDPKKIDKIYSKAHRDLQNMVAANSYLHPNLSNAFHERLKSHQGHLGAYEMQLLKQADEAETEAHKKQREKTDKALRAKNEAFYQSLEETSQKERGMIPGKLFRILLMANPFMGGILAGAAIFGPILDVLQGAKSFNELVLSPIRLVFGDTFADGIVTGISETAKVPVFEQVLGVANLPNEAVSLLTQNPISNAVFGSSGPALTGPLAQLALAGAAAMYDFDKRADMRADKEALRKQGKEGLQQPLKKFNMEQSARRKDAMKDFADKNAVNIHEEHTLEKNLKKEIPNLIENLDEDQQKKLKEILEKKLQKKDTANSLEDLLRGNINNPDVKRLLLLSKAAKGEDIEALQKACESIDNYDKLVEAKKNAIGKEKTNIIKNLYGLEEGATQEELAEARESQKNGIINNYHSKLESLNNDAVKYEEAKRDEVKDTQEVDKSEDQLTRDSTNGQEGVEPEALVSAEQREEEMEVDALVSAHVGEPLEESNDVTTALVDVHVGKANESKKSEEQEEDKDGFGSIVTDNHEAPQVDNQHLLNAQNRRNNPKGSGGGISV